MTLRLRMAGIAGGAVAAVVIVIAAIVYLAVRSDLRGEVDRVLEEQAAPLTASSSAVATGRLGGGVAAGELAKGIVAGGLAAGVVTNGPASGPRVKVPPPGIPASGRVTGGPPAPPVAVGIAIAKGAPQPFTGAGGYIQFLGGDGGVLKSANEGSLQRIPPTPNARTIAARGTGREIVDMRVDGEHMRVLTLGVGPGGAIQLAQPLAEVDHELGNLVVILLVVGGAGILAAALLGAFVARTALAPIARLHPPHRGPRRVGRRDAAAGRRRPGRARPAGAVVQPARSTSSSGRSRPSGSWSPTRATSFARRSPACGRTSRSSSRPTGWASAERESLRRGLIAELDELTDLVGDLVELARGTEPSAAADDVRLDEIVRAAVARAERRAGVGLSSASTSSRRWSSVTPGGSIGRWPTCSTTPSSGARPGARSRRPCATGR